MIILTTFPFYRTRWGKLLDAKEERDTFLRDALIVEVIPTTAFGLAEKHAMSLWHLVATRNASTLSPNGHHFRDGVGDGANALLGDVLRAEDIRGGHPPLSPVGRHMEVQGTG